MKRVSQYFSVIFISIGAIFHPNIACAQLELVHLSSSGFSRTGAGVFLNVGYPVSRSDMVTTEGEVVFFNQAVTTVPLALGYRHCFGRSGSGIYIEPQVAYTLAATDVTSPDSSKTAMGFIRISPPQPQLSGWTGAMSVGYAFACRFSMNIGLRYAHVFVAGAPQTNVLALRLTHTIVCGRRRDR